MPVGYVPSVFISSTCYDLSQIRLDLKAFVEGLGYDALISENPAFPVNPHLDTLTNCVGAVRDRADIFVLIVGKRYGTESRRGNSITNLEYLQAKSKGIPIFVFVIKAILHALPIWKTNPEADFSNVVDNSKLFGFVDGLRNASGHWVYDFEAASDIIETLRQQWALLFTDALNARNRLRAAKLPTYLTDLSANALALMLEKPRAWEHRLFSAVLRDELDRLQATKRDLHYELRIGPVHRLGDLRDIINWTQSQLERITRLVDSITQLVSVALQEALGPPGQPGSAELLVYVARRMADAVEEALRWTIDFSSAYVDEDYRRMLELCSSFSKDIIEKIYKFPDLVDEQTNRAELALAKGEKYSGEAILKLEMPVNQELMSELSRLGARLT